MHFPSHKKVWFPGQGALTHSAHTVAPHSLSAPHVFLVQTLDQTLGVPHREGQIGCVEPQCPCCGSGHPDQAIKIFCAFHAHEPQTLLLYFFITVEKSLICQLYFEPRAGCDDNTLKYYFLFSVDLSFHIVS